MSIEKRLKNDAARFSELQPPSDLRARLQAGLESVPPIHLPRHAVRPVRKWFAPAVAMLSLLMVLVFITVPPLEPTNLLDDNGTRVLSANPGADSEADLARLQEDSFKNATANREDGSAGPALAALTDKALPWDRIGIFAGLAVVTGFLCAFQLKGRPRVLVPALVVLTLFVIIGLISMLGI